MTRHPQISKLKWILKQTQQTEEIHAEKTQHKNWQICDKIMQLLTSIRSVEILHT